ncbi:PaaI family thioesterase [Sphingosinicella terrae]|uniref:PaaI family thioesterase n=1 Tax=Sphingosinicella terrae TaxID=2172047 RepID=UPI000E0D700B|nr:PaaI family thioesterase [Sphingosinicella terrae]
MRELPPYARFLGISRHSSETGETLFVMPFGDVVLGRPGFLHGGAISGLLEFAAMGAIFEAIGAEDGIVVKPINVTVSFMRGGVDHDTFAAATITRLGKRVANVEAHAWQQDRTKPIASAQMNVLLKR